MKCLTIRIPDDLMDWIKEQAEKSQRSKNKQIWRILELEKQRLNEGQQLHDLPLR